MSLLHRLLLFFVFALCACVPETNHKGISENAYFDINGLIEQQITLLDSISPVLLKQAIINSKTEKKSIKQTELLWAKELGIFKSADINNPQLKNSYIVSDSSTADTNTIVYQSKNPSTDKVDYLEITNTAHNHTLNTIRAQLNERNALYQSGKKLELIFGQRHGKTLILQYRISGWQKMIAQDTTRFRVLAKIQYP